MPLFFLFWGKGGGLVYGYFGGGAATFYYVDALFYSDGVLGGADDHETSGVVDTGFGIGAFDFDPAVGAVDVDVGYGGHGIAADYAEWFGAI